MLNVDIRTLHRINAAGLVNFSPLYINHEPIVPEEVIDLLKKLLIPDRDSRITASQALKHKAFDLLKVPVTTEIPLAQGQLGNSFKMIEDK